MNVFRLLLIVYFIVTDARHFNGGTITWVPINPDINSTLVNITITQSYSWSYPTVSCTTNVPISTPTYSSSNVNLTCVADCSTQGGYSNAPVDILTDCTSSSSTLNRLTSERSVNITLAAGAYFSIAYRSSAWIALDSPPQNNLGWSISCLIDLRLRDDGIINTPPVSSVASPQYVIVNTTTQIVIPVSDVNEGDDIRCRWSTYQAGHNRRRRSNEDEDMDHQSVFNTYSRVAADGEIVHIRKKRFGCFSCWSACTPGCPCTCPSCYGTNCTSSTCTTNPVCPDLPTTTASTTLTSSWLYPAIDECGDICYPGQLPSNTTLSNCTISFTGLVPDTWYAVAIQVEDFINDTSTVAMSSVPVQFLIYVLPTPTCSLLPVILPVTSCLDVQVGVQTNVTVFAMNLCGSTSNITDIVASQAITGMTASSLSNSPTNTSLVYVTFTWTPSASQVGSQQLCTIAYDDQLVQSAQYCVVFIVSSATPACITTTIATSTKYPVATARSRTDWALIVGLSLLALLIALCCCGWCLHFLWWGPAAQRRRKKYREKLSQRKFLFFNQENTATKAEYANQTEQIKKPKKNYFVYNAFNNQDSKYSFRVSGFSAAPIELNRSLSKTMATTSSAIDMMRTSTTADKSIDRVSVDRAKNIEKILQQENIQLKPSIHPTIDDSIPVTNKRRFSRRSTATVVPMTTEPECLGTDENQDMNPGIPHPKESTDFSVPPSRIDRTSVDRAKNIEKILQQENIQLKPSIHPTIDDSIPVTNKRRFSRRSTATVVPMTTEPECLETDENQDMNPGIPHPKESTDFSVPPSRIDRTSVVALPRSTLSAVSSGIETINVPESDIIPTKDNHDTINLEDLLAIEPYRSAAEDKRTNLAQAQKTKTFTTRGIRVIDGKWTNTSDKRQENADYDPNSHRQKRASSTGSINVRKLRRSTVDVQRKANRQKTTAFLEHDGNTTNSGITVVKIAQKRSKKRARPSKLWADVHPVID